LSRTRLTGRMGCSDASTRNPARSAAFAGGSQPTDVVRRARIPHPKRQQRRRDIPSSV